MTSEERDEMIGPDAAKKSPCSAGNYQILARKYRPGNLDSLIGQEALVRTLKNAFEMGRVAQAFMLTGVRGVGKTTVARIIAKMANCTQFKENSGFKPCDRCENCVGIIEDRHVDVAEIDAASHTGIDDVREIIESAKYTPVMGRYKIYILDEVHMLSKNAFNGLLKILEEPPLHVKFIFATTEISRVPLTILSRCQRFDLCRVSVAVLTTYYQEIAKKEGFEIADEALYIIARSADGSVRDGLSLLDRALSLARKGHISYDDVATMIGLADRRKIYHLYNSMCKGDAKSALVCVESFYSNGLQPVLIVRDMLDVTWLLMRFKLVDHLPESICLSEVDRTDGASMAKHLSIASLTRNWQILTKGIQEVKSSENALAALEMVVVRFMFAAQMPTPVSLVKAFLKAEDPAIEDRYSKENISNTENVDPASQTKVHLDMESVKAVDDSTLPSHFWQQSKGHLGTWSPPEGHVMTDTMVKDKDSPVWKAKKASKDTSASPMQSGIPPKSQKDNQSVTKHDYSKYEDPLVQSVRSCFPSAYVVDTKEK